MVSQRSARESVACPFIDEADPRCAGRFSLSRLGEAFGICLNKHRCCSIYSQLRRELGEPIPITIHARPLAAPRPPVAVDANGARASGLDGASEGPHVIRISSAQAASPIIAARVAGELRPTGS